jgi:acyl-CoA thioesterase I
MKNKITIYLKRKRLQIIEHIIAKKRLILKSRKLSHKDSDNTRIICYGDSVTNATEIQKGKDFSTLLQDMIQENLVNNKINKKKEYKKVKVVKEGIEGVTTYYGLKYLNKIYSYKPNIVFINFFLNDIDVLDIKNNRIINKTDYRTLKKSMREIVRKIHKNLPNIKIIFWGPTSFTEKSYNKGLHIEKNSYFSKQLLIKQKNYVTKIKKIIKEINRNLSNTQNKSKKKIYFCDIYNYFYENRDKLISSDGIHPNEKGHKVIAKKLFEFIKKLDLIY